MPRASPSCSWFFPAHNEEANLEGLVAEALETLPALADRFEIVIVDDGSRDRTPALADALVAANPGVVRVVHHPTNYGYGAALRSGFRASRYGLIAFTDGDRQFKVADVGRLTARLADADHPDVVAGYRIKRADPFVRTLYARIYHLANRIFFGLRVRDVDCACKLFRREALARDSGGIGRRVLLGRADDQAPGEREPPRGSRRAALPADRGLPDRCEAERHLAGREGFLGPAPADVGEPQAGAPPRGTDPGPATRPRARSGRVPVRSSTG